MKCTIDGSSLVLGNKDKVIKLWDVQSLRRCLFGN
jgi:hypothetical protein